MEGVVVPPAPARSVVGARAVRYRGVIELVLATVVGLVLLPLVFHALSAHDLLVNGKISIVSVVWLVLALVDTGFVLHARSAVASDLATASGGLLANLPRSEGAVPGEAVDPALLGSQAARGLLDLVLLLIVQATLRTPLVAVASSQAPQAIVDGAYVVVVVLIALFMLIRLRALAAPLAERVAWIGLNQLVPTAGFATTTSAVTAFTTRLATTTGGRSTTGTPVSAGRQSVATPSRAEVSSSAPTVLAGPAQGGSEATVAAPPTILAPASAGPESNGEATVLAPPAPTENLAEGRDELVVPPAGVAPPGEATILETPPASPSSGPTPDATIVQTEQEAKPEATETLVDAPAADGTLILPARAAPPATASEDGRK